MKDRGSDHVWDFLDGPFCHTILVMGIRAAKTKKLLWPIDVSHKGVRFERTIVSQVILDNDSLIHAMAFKVFLGADCFHRRETDLMLTLGVARGMLEK
jgi:hypothetical protein